MKQITGYHARVPRCDSRSRRTRVISGSFPLNKPTQQQTIKINEPPQHCISTIHTYNTQYTIIITKCHCDHHTPYSQQY